MEQEIEIWKPVVGYEGLYSVSSLGRVRSEERIDCRGQLRKMKILSPSHNKKGYLLVVLHKNGKPRTFQVHRLVAQAFIPNPDNLPQVNHKSEIKTENFVYVNDYGSVDLEKSSLEWCTNEYNRDFGTRNQRVIDKLINGKNSKQVLQYTLDGVFVREWPSMAEIERQLGFCHEHISRCCNGKLKQSYGFVWKHKQKGAA